MFTGWVTTMFTLQLNVYTVAISSVNKFVINEWLRLNNSGFLMQPHPHAKKQYGAKVQHAKPHDDTPLLNKAGKKFIQEVTGVFLYLAQAVDLTMLTPLSALASKQAAPTENMMKDCLQFLDYTASQEDAIVTY